MGYPSPGFYMRRPAGTRNCVVCGTEFQPVAPRQTHCGALSCKQARQRLAVERYLARKKRAKGNV